MYCPNDIDRDGRCGCSTCRTNGCCLIGAWLVGASHISSVPHREDRKQSQDAKPDAFEPDYGRWEDEGGHSR